MSDNKRRGALSRSIDNGNSFEIGAIKKTSLGLKKESTGISSVRVSTDNGILAQAKRNIHENANVENLSGSD